jgi:hypothetical protein
MADVFAEPAAVVSHNGRAFVARVCGAPMGSAWQGWIEFTAVDTGETIRTPRETTQSKRTDMAYWASGLTASYLDGALARALRPPPVVRQATPPAAAYDEPAPAVASSAGRAAPPNASVLDPFSVYQKGEIVLRQELGALASWHLVNIIRAYGLSEIDAAALDAMPAGALIEMIVAGVKAADNRGAM